ncbi:pyridoxal-dependent decarboxylase [Halosimplex aquaticum]
MAPEHVYEAYRAFSRADSITVDPHKMGFVPYAAGGFVVRDERALDTISYSAPYILEESAEMPDRLGSYILEGSKPGATAAAVWAANRVVPLSLEGYGQLVGRGVEGAHRFFHSLESTDEIAVGDRRVAVQPVTRPDLNIVDFAFNEVGNERLDAMNDLNEGLYERCSYRNGPVYTKDFVTSKTTLDAEAYGDVPGAFAAELGIPEDAWNEVGSVTVLRSCVLTPYLAYDTTYGEYWETFMGAMREHLADILGAE